MIRKNIAHWVKQGAGEQVWFVPNSWGSEGESKPQEILQFFASFKFGNSISST